MKLFSLIFLLLGFSKPSLKYEINGFTQGTTYHIIYYNNGEAVNKFKVDSILSCIDKSLSIYDANSLVSKFNRSKNGVKVDDHFINVVKRSKEIYQVSDGLFDITVLPLMEAWGFTAKNTKPSEPNEAALQKLKKIIGSNKISLKGNKLSKQNKDIRIDVNGIAQGYSVDVLAEYLLAKGIKNFLVEIGGEVRAEGRKQSNGEKFSIGIMHPASFESGENRKVYLDDGAVTTSGNYQKYYEHNGTIVSHLMNPKTCRPINNELISVTVFAKDAITADGYDNALMAMGLKEGLAFVREHKELAAYFIYKKEDGTVADTASQRFRDLYK